jgi:hypothetical protein
MDYKWKECTFLMPKFEVFIVGIVAGKLLFGTRADVKFFRRSAQSSTILAIHSSR